MAAPRRIYFDNRWAGKGGIGRFAADVLLRLEHCTPVTMMGSPSSMLNPFTLSWLSFVCRKGILFMPGYIPPLFSFGPYAFTMHDLNHYDRNVGGMKRLFYSIFIKRGCQQAIKVLTVSEFSRRRIIEWSGVAPEKVVNVGVGVDACFTPAGGAYQPGYPYLLCVSTRKEHKNEPRLIRAFSSARVDPCLKLIFTGQPTTELLALIASLGVAERVIFAGKVPDADLPALYRGALVLIFPSLYEGFGLPVIEAMACGTPVITSNTTSLPEAAGNAALLVDPESEESISHAIEQLHDDESLRQTLTAAGLLQAKKFTWEATVAKIKAVLTVADPQ